MMMMVVVVVVVWPMLPVLGSAPVLVPIFGGQVTRLGGHAQICPQTCVHISVSAQRALRGAVATVPATLVVPLVLLRRYPL